MLTLFASLALAAQAGQAPVAEPLRARISVFARIISAAEVRDGHTDEPHQRRKIVSTEGEPLTLIEFE
jgi:hypothetical protein